MVGALVVGFIAGVLARVLMFGDVFRHLGGPVSWLISIGLGVLGAVVGWVVFTLGLGIGDDAVFDLGSLPGAIVGTMIVIAVANWFVRRDRQT